MAIRLRGRAEAFLLGVMVLSLILSACASNASTTSGLGISGHTIRLGILTPLSGPVAAPIGIPLTRGIETFFDAVNAQGGIDGYQVQLVEEDTQYDPQREIVEYNKIHNQVLMIAESLGTEPSVAISHLVLFDHMLVSAATLDSSLTHQKYLFFVGTPYRLQVENSFDYVVNKLGVKNPRTGIIYQGDDYGLDGLAGYNESVPFYHLHDVAQATITVGQQDMSGPVLQMKAAGAQYVILTTLPADTANIILTAHALGYDPQWILQSPAFSTLLMGVPALATLLSQHAWNVNQGDAWGDTTQTGMVEMMQDVERFAPDQKPDGYFEYGYAEAKVTYAILKKAADAGNLTRDGVFNAFQSLGTVDLGGLYPRVHYGSSSNPNDRVPSRDSTIYAIDPNAPNTTYLTALTDDFTGQAAQQAQF